MKAEEYDKLTDESKRVKVAELCGWEKASQESMEAYWRLGHPKATWYWMHEFGDVQPIEHLPDYLNDLNACHEFEELIPKDKEYKWEHLLGSIVGAEWIDYEGWFETVPFLRATAEQRCKAFVLTMTGGEA